ncbi:2'-5'-oligoadenylate synthase 3 [Acomys russatus]|uniref:2'-5'-oligoadenylate synthase 3 n=1 Tax=Acomys russatus TaxID=60746 RepID=UPI0021E3041A|nr:2'-5'-oligoadenylate synthase 3 [Acomys russatus]
MDLYHTPAEALDKLVAHSLHPLPEFTAAVRGALQALDIALRERGALGSQRPRVLRIAKGGAHGRGTALRGGCDVELVIFLNSFRSYEDQRTCPTETLGAMRALLESWGRHPGPGLTFQFSEPKASGDLQFRLASADQENWVDVVLVPAFDVLGPPCSGVKPTPQVYSSLLSSGCQAGEHAACFTELRKNFVNIRPAKLKNLILLVKHWYRQVCWEATSRVTLPPSYALELLTIFAWEQGCRKDTFSLAQGLRTVLALIHQNKHLCIFWTENYGLEDPVIGEFLRRQLERPRPVILDPADPTWDLGNGTAWRWDVLAKEAESCFNQRCLLQVSGVPVQPWEGLGLPRPGILGLGHPIRQGPSQAFEDNKGHGVVPPRTRSLQPSNPAPRLPKANTKVPSVPKPAASKATIYTAESGMGPDLSQIPSKELDSFIHDHLKPSPHFQKQVRQAIDAILRCLREKCVYKASRVSKGGSFGRGTDLRGSCNVELVIFYKALRDFKGQRSHQAEILCDIQTQLQSWCQDPVPGLSLQFAEQTRPNALQLQLVSTDLSGWVDISVLPAFDAVGPLNPGAAPQPQVYSSLLSSGCQAGEHAACFAELRRNFVNIRPVKLKSLMLVVKHWYRQVATRNKGGEAAGAPLPPAYALELLTVFAWEQGYKKQKFSTAEGLRTVLRLVQQHQSLCVYWTVNYSVQDPALRAHLLGQLRKARPLVLDPGDPTWNVAQGSWELLAQEAAALESQVCLQSGDGTLVPPWDVMPALLHQTPAEDLDKFISEFLQPDRHFLTQVKRAVDTICSFLKENCFRNSTIKVLKVVKGGSSAKGTALQGRSDADLVVFLSCFRQFSEQGSHRAEIISEIQAQLEACRQKQRFEVRFEISTRKNPRVLSFSLTSKTLLDQSVSFDVLPAFDALGQLRSGSRPDPQVYRDLIHSYSNADEFSTCFTELQRDFVSSRPTKLKSLIRLVKHWYQQCTKMVKGKGSLPPQHGLELLTVYAWEQGSQNLQFNMAEGFRTVLELVGQYRQLCIYWTINYSAEDKSIGDFLKMQLQKPRPVILDPADPTGNLGHNARWDLLANEAKAFTSALCCMDKDGTPVKPWPVKRASCGAAVLPMYCERGHHEAEAVMEKSMGYSFPESSPVETQGFLIMQYLGVTHTPATPTHALLSNPNKPVGSPT